MRPWRNKALLIAGVAALAVAIPAIGQSTPESLLPPGFGDPEPAPKEEPKAQTPADPATPSPEDEPVGEARPTVRGPVESPIPEITDSAEEDLRAVRPTRPTYTLDVPDALRRPTDLIGPLDPSNWGLRADAFGTSRGAFMATLMRRLEAPIPSRWTSMLLRRALMSRVPAPAGVDPVDWVADRAGLLLRMGEADAARSLVQSVDVVAYTPRMIQTALDTALATSDPAALCPLIVPGRSLSDSTVWGMADAMCAAMAGEAGRASELIDRARSRGEASGADLLLAEKVVGAGTDSRRAVNIRWEEVERLTPWRVGLIGATGAEVPERLVDQAEPRIQAFFARAAMVPAERRMEAAYVAAALGVFSSSALVEMQSLLFEAADPEQAGNTPAGRLRIAYAHRDPAQRIRALRDLWDDGEGPLQRYGRSILTAFAATRIAPSEERAEDADELIAAMLSAGLDQEAARWTGLAAGGDSSPLAAALLAVGSPRAPDDPSGVVASFRGADESKDDRRTQMLVAGLAGLDRIPAEEASQLAADLGMPLGRQDRWTRALDEAVRARQPGTVALLAGVGMQAPDWQRVPPSHLFRVVRALRLAGFDYEARMIAAEAVMRL